MTLNLQSKRILAIALLLLNCGLPVLAQELLRVNGVVVDEDANPMIGVTVRAEGTSTGAITDLDGRFILQVKRGTKLTFSYLGYHNEVATASPKMKITMKENSKVLDDVVVVGYGIQKKSSVTGAISQVKAEDMQHRTITDANQALQGKTSGVQVISTSAAPGSTPTVRIRGFSSNVSSSPLYVVDGVRVSSIAGIDPNDIASMEILKDAASAAIYGAEAGNGVVLITTKKGTVGQGKINYEFQYASQSVARVPKMLNAEEYITYMTEAGAFTEEYMLKNWDGVTNTNWADETFESSPMIKHNLSFQGGNDRGNYYLSLAYLHNDGIVKGKKDYYNRLNATINAEYRVKNWLKIGSSTKIEKYNSASVSSQNEYGSVLTAVLTMDPLTPVYYSADNLPYFMLQAQANGHTLLQADNGDYYAVSRFSNGEQYNPLMMADNYVAKYSGYNVGGVIYADLTPFKGFTFTSRLGYNFSGTRTPYVTLPFYGNATQSRDYVGLSSTNSTGIYYQWENFANYTRTFGGHTITGMIGMSYQESTSDYVTGSLTANDEDAITKNDPLFYYLNYKSASATQSVSGEKTRTAKLSYFGRLSYNYRNRYFAQFSLRADAADLSMLPRNKRWGYFPACSLGWTLSEEKFFEPLRRTFDSVKLRASWGQNGSLSALGSYSYGTDMAQSGVYALEPGLVYTKAVSPTTMGNDDLKWETSEQFDVGLDLYALNSRLNFSVDYFNKKTKDLLVWGTTPSLEIGGTTSPINAGNVRNRGFEFELGWRDHVGDFNYSVRGNLSTLSNKVTYIDPSITRISGATFHTYTITYFEQGYPVYYFRGYKFKGVDPETGDPTFYDLDNDGSINENDLTNIGDGIPSFTYGITLTAAYKGFDFTLFGTGAQGNDIFCCINRPDYLTWNKMKDYFYDGRWTTENTNASVPRAGANNMDKYSVSDAMVKDGSYFKIKQIQLGYTLPKKWLNKIYINNLRVYVSLDDFFTFTSYKGFDPEASANSTSGMGVDKGAYPLSKKVVVGASIEF
ncbi:MAG: SusC/RagA family TonB-linked outer membrane protein [Prevotella sp.]|jgi:TonB-linked SusC/RagA family outer membrane protein